MSGDSLFLQRLASNPVVITAGVTRPNDTTAYVAGDAIANATSGAAMLTFSGVARKPGGAFLLNGLTMHFSGNPTNKLDAFLYLLDTTLSSPPNDNAAIALTNAENKTVQHVVFLPGQSSVFNLNIAGSGINGEMVMSIENINRLLVCAAASTSLFAMLVVANASGYTPIAVEDFTFRLYGEQL